MNFAIIAQGATGGGGGILGFLPFILIMVIVYLMMIRPQMKKQKEHTKMLTSLQRNDDVITSGGIHGRIVHIAENEPSVQIQIAKGIIVTVERGSISRKKDAGDRTNQKKLTAVESRSQKDSLNQQQSRDSAVNIVKADVKEQESPLSQALKNGEGGMITSGTGVGSGHKSKSRRGGYRRYSSKGRYQSHNQNKTSISSE